MNRIDGLEYVEEKEYHFVNGKLEQIGKKESHNDSPFRFEEPPTKVNDIKDVSKTNKVNVDITKGHYSTCVEWMAKTIGNKKFTILPDNYAVIMTHMLKNNEKMEECVAMAMKERQDLKIYNRSMNFMGTTEYKVLRMRDGSGFKFTFSPQAPYYIHAEM
jgi:hypothetical protein